MKILKILLNLLLSFILMIGILCSTFLVIGNIYINKENILKKFEQINFYNSIYEEIRDGFENYIYQSGLDINIIDKICTREKVKNDILIVVNSMYGQGDSTIDSTEIRNNLDNAINEYVVSQGRKISKQEQDNIKKFEDLIEESYKEEIGLYQKGSDKIARSLPRVINLIQKGQIISIGITALLLIILIIVNSKKVSIAGSYVGVSLLSSGVIMVAIKNIITSKIDIDNLVIFTKSLSNAVINIIFSILKMIQSFGIFYIIVGIFVILVMNYIITAETRIK